MHDQPGPASFPSLGLGSEGMLVSPSQLLTSQLLSAQYDCTVDGRSVDPSRHTFFKKVRPWHVGALDIRCPPAVPWFMHLPTATLPAE